MKSNEVMLKKIDVFLFPSQEKNHYTAYVWLVYLGIFFTSLYYHHPIDNSFFYATIGTLLFLVVYFSGYNTRSTKIIWHIFLILIIASFMTILTPGASVFFVYAAAFCCRIGDAKKAFFGVIIVSLWIIVLAVLFDFSSYFYIPALLYSLIIGGVNIYQYNIEEKNIELLLSQKEVKNLAIISERERISRDLHDLIGHTFSVITLKAELAQKLIDKDNSKAKDEIHEIGNISREALKQVREVVTGYRTSDLNTELAHAKYVLESNDIQFNYHFEKCKMNDMFNKELAIILKELTTNILKHAQATQVFTEITMNDNTVQLKVEDNGVGFETEYSKGFGLKGIKERVNKLSGSFTMQSSQNSSDKTIFTINLPLTISP